MSFPAHESYRDSEVEWLGEVPSHWRSVPFWSLFRRVKRLGFGSEELLSVYRDYGVIRKSDRDDNFNNPSDDLDAYQLVEPGDLAVNKMKAWQGSLGISPVRGIVSPAYFVYRALHRENPGYLHYLLRSPSYAAGFMTISKGIRTNQWDVDPDHLSQLPIPIPPLPEQTAIAAFLDRETAKIDALVEAQRRLIELLKEKRQAVISHSVTKGLDPSAAMKDSGVEWLGKVPAHWDVVTVRRIATGVQTGTTPSSVPASADLEDGISWFTPGDFGPSIVLGEAAKQVAHSAVESGEARVFSAGSVLVVGIGATLGRVGVTPFACSANQQINSIAGDNSISPLFLAHALSVQEQVMRRLSNASTIGIMNQERTKDLCLCRPPLHEQAEIVGEVEVEARRTDELITSIEQASVLLQERRSALISAAVTGKIDVRGLVPGEEEAA